MYVGNRNLMGDVEILDILSASAASLSVYVHHHLEDVDRSLER